MRKISMQTLEKTLPDNVDELKQIILDLQSDYQKIKENFEKEKAALFEEINYWKNKVFGRRSESLSREKDGEVFLFNEAEMGAESMDQETEEEAVEIKSYSRKKKGRKPLPESLPRDEIIHDIDEDEKTCPCGCQLTKIGEEISEKLEIIPPKAVVKKHIRYKYACRSCEGVASEDTGGAVKIAKPPVQLLPKTMATESTLAYLATSKFCDHLPFYRQEKIFKRLKIDIPRQTMCRWMMMIAEKVNPVLKLMKREIIHSRFLGIDETPVQVLREPGRDPTSKSYMWVFRGGRPDKPIFLYEYRETRAGKFLPKYLEGFKGSILTDGFSGYNALLPQNSIKQAACWAHARRKFFDAAKDKKITGTAHWFVNKIGKLYNIERKARRENMDPDQIKQLRQKEAKPVLDQIKEHLDKKAQTVIADGLTGKAINYTLKLWDKLIVYLEDGFIPIDNNLVENAIRPFAVGRKNWMFFDSQLGVLASAVLYSLIETAKANGLDPYWYLRYLFLKIPYAKNESDYEKLLPTNLDNKTIMLYQN